MKKKNQNKIRIPVPQKPPKVEESNKTYKRRKFKKETKKIIEQQLRNNGN